ncbi:hypothetical protein DFJ58DRAFT_914837 [Suillus subalutaceus]|uniref:uncharacterized protein n=1 Tax=Suillus subalutaceus TaxID=48586 RepID=UPI001B864F5D|nr:uncharacterized protein DFJ58DRAFT_914837 [Suillus subalutaceus]KAG1849685.1 hypothetical protein DFJ58DRAFT_914837 [Suillus subalutaceus]
MKSRASFRAHGVQQNGHLVPGSLFVRKLLTFNESLQAHALTLWSTRIPFDGDPPVVDSTTSQTEEEVFDWDDEPCVDLDFVPDYVPSISALSASVIAFDLFGTILDRDGAVDEAMLYLECKLMRHRDNPDALYTDIVRHALEDVCTFLGALLSEVLLREAVQTILQPGLYADARVANQSEARHKRPDPSRRRTTSFANATTNIVLLFILHQWSALRVASGNSAFAALENVSSAFHVLTGSEVAVKMEIPADAPTRARCTALRSSGVRYTIMQMEWYERRSTFLVLDRVGANLKQLRRVCRGDLSLKTVAIARLSKWTCPAGHQPKTSRWALGRKSNMAKLYVDHLQEHIYRSMKAALDLELHDMQAITCILDEVRKDQSHFPLRANERGAEQGRRDDLEAGGNVLLYLLHGRLPWQGIYAPSIEAKLLRIGEMRAGLPFRDLLVRSPVEFTTYFDHCRGLKFDEKLNYALLRQLFSQIMVREGWTENTGFDWEDASPRKDVRFTEDDVSTLQYPNVSFGGLATASLVIGSDTPLAVGSSNATEDDLKAKAFFWPPAPLTFFVWWQISTILRRRLPQKREGEFLFMDHIKRRFPLVLRAELYHSGATWQSRNGTARQIAKPPGQNVAELQDMQNHGSSIGLVFHPLQHVDLTLLVPSKEICDSAIRQVLPVLPAELLQNSSAHNTVESLESGTYWHSAGS